MKIVLFFLSFLFVQLSSAQDLTGIWRGNFNSSDRVLNMLNIEDQYKFEVQVEQNDKALNGVTYSYKTTVFYGKATANGSVNAKTGKVMLQEIKTVELRMQQNSYACIMTCFLQYTKNGDEEFLEGTYDSYGEKDSSRCGRGTVFLRKVTTSDFHKEPFLVKRSIESQQAEIVAKNKTAASLAKDKPKVAAGKSAAKKPGTTATATLKKKTDSTATAKAAKPVPPKTGSSLKPVPKKTDSTALAKKTPSTTKPQPAKPEPPVKSLKPMENSSIPGLARTDTQATAVPDIKKAIPTPRALASRENELVKTINISSREVVVNIYDNGTIDHDTISVYLDKKLVVSKQMLTTAPITVKFTVGDDNEYHELVMVAENLGDIPPNTSLMVVKSGDQNIEVRITSTEQKNAVVAFRYKKPA